MRVLSPLLALLLLPLFVCAEPARPGDLPRAFQLAGLRLLCEQSAPLIQHGLDQRQKVAQAFAADALCDELARQVAGQLEVAEVREVERLLDSPLAQRFTAAERAVGEAGDTEGLAAYREKLKSAPPRADRLALVQRLDQAAQTSALAARLRQEVDKTRLLLALRARGQPASERRLEELSARQLEALRSSSRAAVESFMFFAYRRIPSAELSEYAALYEQAPVRKLLEASVEALPGVFAARREAL
ncbi:hypothetical protein [Zestomonas thermotolerans]|uniref:hypothetical protein n=1 Tax=Zestomonas thermotolerans TaxID=157784 RepID=UPI00048A00BB|nr:hypothetical protein [Pseudomonas thermotolerans]